MPLLQVGLNSATLLGLTQLPGGVSKGYLRVLSFTEDSVLVDQRTVQLSAAALNNYEPLSTGPLIVQQNGYVSVYVGNESAADVYFDDLTIEHRQGLQVQENQYDPFGLDLAGVSSAAPELRLKNFYQFNGKENQLDLGLNWNHQDWRFFDYQIGRWHVVDPEIENGQESWGPYSFGFDNAVRYADANGRNPGDGEPLGTLAGLFRNTVIGIGVSAFNVVQSVLPLSPVALALNGGQPIQNVRASVDDYGNVSAGVRPVSAASDALDFLNVAAVALSAGGAGLASRGLPMGAGLLMAEAGGEKVVANSVVQEVKADLHAFGNATRPAPLRIPKDIELNSRGNLPSQVGVELPKGKSTTTNPRGSGLKGPYHTLSKGTKMPDGLGIKADGVDALPHTKGLPGQRASGHNTIYPTREMHPSDFDALYYSLPWQKGGKI